MRLCVAYCFATLKTPEEDLSILANTTQLVKQHTCTSIYFNNIEAQMTFRHLLSDQSDPFNRAPLTMDQVRMCYKCLFWADNLGNGNGNLMGGDGWIYCWLWRMRDQFTRKAKMSMMRSGVNKKPFVWRKFSWLVRTWYIFPFHAGWTGDWIETTRGGVDGQQDELVMKIESKE